MGPNIYNQPLLLGAVAADAAQLTGGTIYDLDKTGAKIAALSVPVLRLAGGNHATGVLARFGGLSSQVADGNEATLVLHAVELLEPGRCLVTPLTTGITLTYSTKTLQLPTPDGGVAPPLLRMADTVGAVTLSAYGAALAAAYTAFTPQPISPADNTPGGLLLPSLPAMWGVAFDLYGSSAHDRYVLAGSYS